MARRQSPSHRLVRFWTWRDNLHQRLVATREEDAAHHAAFIARAAEVSEQVEFLTRNGLNEGAMEALGALAEQDMVDFCVMVDLAADVPMDDVAPLQPTTRRHLQEFLNSEPWHSLMVDNDLVVALAMVEGVAAAGKPWYEASPNLVRVVARVLDQASAEQVQRFAGELNALHGGADAPVPEDAAEILRFAIGNAARRLGMRPPQLFA